MQPSIVSTMSPQQDDICLALVPATAHMESVLLQGLYRSGGESLLARLVSPCLLCCSRLHAFFSCSCTLWMPCCLLYLSTLTI
jgi:hypothetical protein